MMETDSKQLSKEVYAQYCWLRKVEELLQDGRGPDLVEPIEVAKCTMRQDGTDWNDADRAYKAGVTPDDYVSVLRQRQQYLYLMRKLGTTVARLSQAQSGYNGACGECLDDLFPIGSLTPMSLDEWAAELDGWLQDGGGKGQ